jgi:hypothetical protein
LAVVGSSWSVMVAIVALTLVDRSSYQPRSILQTWSAVSVTAASSLLGLDAPHPRAAIRIGTHVAAIKVFPRIGAESGTQARSPSEQ